MPSFSSHARRGRQRGGIAGSAAAFACLLGLSSPAQAADVGKCVEANAHAQDLRRDEKLAAARAELMTCGNPECPQLVR